MNLYEGKTCPYCKTAFQDGDDIVVCNACEMPHHKECWVENQGCTTFGCSGTIMSAGSSAPQYAPNAEAASYFLLQAPTAVPAVEYCARCGARRVPDGAFCAKCGYKYPEPDQQTNPACGGTAVPPSGGNPYRAMEASAQPNGYSYGGASSSYSYANGTVACAPAYLDYASQEAQYIVRNVEYYQAKFAAMRARNKTVSWNWAAFFVAPLWCLYRKLYGWSIGIIVAEIVLSELRGLSSLLTLAGYCVFGLYANSIYMNRIHRLITEEQGLQEPYRAKYVKRNAGVSVTAIVIAIVILVALETIAILYS